MCGVTCGAEQPVVAVGDGIIMGGGAGIFQGAGMYVSQPDSDSDGVGSQLAAVVRRRRNLPMTSKGVAELT